MLPIFFLSVSIRMSCLQQRFCNTWWFMTQKRSKRFSNTVNGRLVTRFGLPMTAKSVPSGGQTCKWSHFTYNICCAHELFLYASKLSIFESEQNYSLFDVSPLFVAFIYCIHLSKWLVSYTLYTSALSVLSILRLLNFL